MKKVEMEVRDGTYTLWEMEVVVPLPPCPASCIKGHVREEGNMSFQRIEASVTVTCGGASYHRFARYDSTDEFRNSPEDREAAYETANEVERLAETAEKAAKAGVIKVWVRDVSKGEEHYERWVGDGHRWRLAAEEG